MSATDEDTELRDLVAQTLHQQGVLSKIKAQLRASIFLALDEHEQGKIDTKSPLVNEKLKQFLETKEGLEAVSLIREFLQFFDLDYTLAVFEPELNHIEQSQFLNSEELRETHKVGSEDSSVPLLVQVLKNTPAESSIPSVKSDNSNKSISISAKPSKKPDPPQLAPAVSANADVLFDLEESLDRKDGLMGSFSYEESPRSPRKPLTNLNNFGDSLQVNNALSNEATKSQLFDDNEKNLGASHVSDLYEDDFGSSANSINLPKSSARSGKGVGGISGLIEKSEISEDLEDQEDEVEEELSEPLEEEEPTNDKNAKNNDVTSDHSVSRISDTEGDMDYMEDPTTAH
ncbi:uncharacterized protein LOC142351477 isoform X2 [Convolutriloba macropyga]|uniref:uncharacterized protein LOC142351477 isoform X2 n=1 Tax=Convolutriloba macropyga TaxID=536237 RepID=UPI003F51D3D3